MDEQTLEQQEYYLYIIKNYDIDEALSKSNLPDIDKNYIKDRFLSSDVDLKEKVEIINSLLKYYKIEYRRNEVIQEKNSGSGNFNLVPGFYFIEMVGGNGGCDAIGSENEIRSKTNNFIFRNFIVNDFFKNVVNTNIKLQFTTHFQWLYSSNSVSRYGTYEINNFGIFLHLEKELPYYTENFSLIQTDGVENVKKFYDFSKIILLRSDDNFKKLSFNLLGKFSSNDEQIYHTISLTKNLRNIDFESSFLYTNVQSYRDFYNSYCNENIGNNVASFATTSFYDFIENNNINVAHGGSPGIIKKILKIDKLTTFNYTIGEAGTTDLSLNSSRDGKNTTLNSIDNTIRFIAEGGKAAKFDGTNWNYNFRDSNYNEVLKEKIGPDVETEFSCVSETLNGKGTIQINDISQSFDGSIIDGQGIQLNDFETLYYSNKKDGYIVVKFLGPLSNSLCSLNISLGSGLSCSSFDEKLISNSNYSFIVKLNSRKDILNFDTSKINGISIKDYLENNKVNLKIKKYKNYYEFSFDCIEPSFDFYFEKIEKNYYFIEKFSDNTIKYDYINYISTEDIIKFYFKDDNTINKNLLLVYNALNDNENLFSKDGNTTTLNFTNSNKNIYIPESFEKLYEVIFNIGNEIQLEPKTSYITGEVIFDDSEKIGTITKIEYSTDNMSLFEYSNKFTVGPNSELLIKFTFSSKRVKISKELSGLDSSVRTYPLNFNPITNTLENSSYFQFIKVSINRNTEYSFYISKNTYKLDLFEDLNGYVSINTVGNTSEIEYTDEVVLKFYLKKNMYISLRDLDLSSDIDQSTGKINKTNNYIIGFYDKENFESSILIGSSFNEEILLGDEIQYEDFGTKYSSIKFAKNSLHGKCITSRPNNSFFYSSESTYKKNLESELCFYVFKMPEENISIRLSSDYIKNSKLFDILELNEDSVSLNKDCYVRYIASGGNSGNGGDGYSIPMQSSQTRSGGSGSSGFKGGKGGSGGSTSAWSIFVSGFIPRITFTNLIVPIRDWNVNLGPIKPTFSFDPSLGIAVSVPGVGGLGAPGFLSGGIGGEVGSPSMAQSPGECYYNYNVSVKSLKFTGHDCRENKDNKVFSFDKYNSDTYSLSKYKGSVIDSIIHVEKDTSNSNKKQTSTILYSICGKKGADGISSVLQCITGKGVSASTGYYVGDIFNEPLLRSNGTADNLYTAYPWSNILKGKTGYFYFYPRIVDGSGCSASGAHAGYPTLLNIQSNSSKLSIDSINPQCLYDQNAFKNKKIQNILLGGGVDGDTVTCTSTWCKCKEHNGGWYSYEAEDVLEWGWKMHIVGDWTNPDRQCPISWSSVVKPPKMIYDLSMPYFKYFLTAFIPEGNTYFILEHNRKYGDGCGSDSLHVNNWSYKYTINTKNTVTSVNNFIKDILSKENTTLILSPDITEKDSYIIKKGINFNSFSVPSSSYEKVTNSKTSNLSVGNVGSFLNLLNGFSSVNGPLISNACSILIYKGINRSSITKDKGTITFGSVQIEGRNWMYEPSGNDFVSIN